MASPSAGNAFLLNVCQRNLGHPRSRGVLSVRQQFKGCAHPARSAGMLLVGNAPRSGSDVRVEELPQDPTPVVLGRGSKTMSAVLVQLDVGATAPNSTKWMFRQRRFGETTMGSESTEIRRKLLCIIRERISLQMYMLRNKEWTVE